MPRDPCEVVYGLTAGEFQNIAREVIGRELSDNELARVVSKFGDALSETGLWDTMREVIRAEAAE